MAFRRINVDQYDEDHSIATNNLIPENPLSDDELVSKVESTASQVRSLLQRGDTHAALATVLSLQPYGTSPALVQAKVGDVSKSVALSICAYFCSLLNIRQRMLPV